MELDDIGVGFLLGILAGEGHFGGDGKQAQITLRMHVRHEKLFHWLCAVFPQSELYGPYHHGGRSYFQWMARGNFLRQELIPLIAQHVDRLDDHVTTRFLTMCKRYRIQLPNPLYRRSM